MSPEEIKINEIKKIVSELSSIDADDRQKLLRELALLENIVVPHKKMGELKCGMKSVEIYTDGACKGNPGPGGFGTVLRYGSIEKRISKGFFLTTNNRMELTAAIEGFKVLNEPCNVELYSDSKYLIDGMSKGWASKWKANNWIKSDKKPALNTELWEQLLMYDSVHNVKYIWVKGHNGNKYNEECDKMAVAASESPTEIDIE